MGTTGYLTMAAQHPDEDLPRNTTANVDAQRAYMVSKRREREGEDRVERRQGEIEVQERGR